MFETHHTMIGDCVSCNQTANMQWFIVHSIDFFACMPKHNLPLATFLAPTHLPLLVNTSTFGGHICSGRRASLNCLHSGTTGSIDQLVEQHSAGLWLYRMCFYSKTCQIMQCSCFKLNMRGIHVSHACCGMWPKPLHEHLTCSLNLQQACTWPWQCMHMTMEQCQLSNYPCPQVTSKHGYIPSNILTWWNAGVLSMHEHDLQTTLPTSQHTLACVPCSMATKCCWSESFLAPFLFSAGNVLWSFCFVHIAWAIHTFFFIYGLLSPSSFTLASIM